MTEIRMVQSMFKKLYLDAGHIRFLIIIIRRFHRRRLHRRCIFPQYPSGSRYLTFPDQASLLPQCCPCSLTTQFFQIQ